MEGGLFNSDKSKSEKEYDAWILSKCGHGGNPNCVSASEKAKFIPKNTKVRVGINKKNEIWYYNGIKTKATETHIYITETIGENKTDHKHIFLLSDVSNILVI